ncbi:MAG: MBL fold metallo-hydrolase, partial [Candidatus Adiutricales bacterium]
MTNINGDKGQQFLEQATRPGKDQAMQVINYQDVHFAQPLPDVHVARILIANASWVNTTEGTVVIDTLLFPLVAQKMLDRIRETGGPIKYVIYTHGHGDHVGGAQTFLEDSPEIIGQRLITERFETYRILAEHRARMGA